MLGFRDLTCGGHRESRLTSEGVEDVALVGGDHVFEES